MSPRSRSRRILLTVLLLIASLAPGDAAASELERAFVTHDGVVRTFGWYVGGAAPELGRPVVLVLHGGGGSADQMWTIDHGASWRRLADDHGLVVLLPEGRADPDRPGSHHWNDCRSGIEEPTATGTADDVGFIRAVVEWVAARWPVDRERVYVTGPSNGGMMTYRLLAEAPDLVAAGAAIIANLPAQSECRDATTPRPVLIMNGTEDPLMPWAGGCVGPGDCERGTVLSTAATLAAWRQLDGTGPGPGCRDLADRDPVDGSTVVVCSYGPGAAGTGVVVYRLEGGGHAVPGPDPIPLWYQAVVGRKNHDIDAAEEIWRFFARYRRGLPAPRTAGARAVAQP